MIWQKNSLGRRVQRGKLKREVEIGNNKSGRGLNAKLNLKLWILLSMQKRSHFEFVNK